jgi:energy-coupling factor transporter ATP-binding protein EcfA2
MTAFDPDKITFFAKTDARGREVAFGIKAKDRQRHMYVVGKTGMGKSTLLENMAAQDIMNGEGMAFIDPHGSAAETLLEYVPEHRVKDVVYFAPFDLEHPISFNVMEDVGPDKRHLVVSGLMSTFKKIWVDAWSARMEYILTNALLALIEYPDTTLLSVNRLFVDKEFRKKVVDYIQDPAVKAFWTDEFANYTDRFTAEALPAIQNKIGQFTGNPLIRNIIGQPHSSFDIRELMDNQKILIMNLSKGLIGETNANLLGSMLTTRIYLAAMSRADLPVEKMKQMPNFYFYVDEFQSFANATFANILSEARKYHLNLIIAHQYIEQMEEDVRSAVFGNVGTTVAFRVGPFDAEVLETVFAPRFVATDLVNLGFAQIYLTLMIDGIGSHPFSAKTLPPVERPSISCREMVLRSSRQQYAHDRVAVEKIVAELHTPTRPEVRTDDRRKNLDRRASGAPAQSVSKPPFVPRERNGVVAPKNNDATVVPKEKPIPIVEVPIKKRPPEKTPEDLRQILASLTQKKQEVAVVTPDTSVSTSVPVPENPPVQKNESAATPVLEKPNNLKWALAEALQTMQSSPAAAEAPAPQRQSLVTASPQPEARKMEEKNRLSSMVVVPRSAVQSPEENRAFYQSRVRNVVVEHRRQQPAAPVPVTPEKPTAQSNRLDSRSGLDVGKIKRMLGQSDQERSPFK